MDDNQKSCTDETMQKIQREALGTSRSTDSLMHVVTTFPEIRVTGLAARVILLPNGCLLAGTSDGETCVSNTIEQVVDFLYCKNVENESLFMPDWRDCDIAPSATEQISIRWGLRKRRAEN
ncbi:hypothetical protein [Noviherbaspirillum sp.]|uniref:hypothetical protein n=1 Tax=Noviherbaspirillum sp. TaxID=1926288 RepID=UPI002FE0EAB2